MFKFFYLCLVFFISVLWKVYHRQTVYMTTHNISAQEYYDCCQVINAKLDYLLFIQSVNVTFEWFLNEKKRRETYLNLTNKN